MEDLRRVARKHAARNGGLACGALVLSLALVLAGGAAARLQPRADLVESQLARAPARVADGGFFTAADGVVNRGAAHARASLTRYYLRARGSRLLVGARRVPALAPHSRSHASVRLRVPASAPAAGYSLVACADAARRVPEANERNNCRAARGLMTVVAASAPEPPPAPAPPPQPTPPADSDADGTPDAVDCAPHDASIHPGALDAPDFHFVDSNCDGIDGDASQAIFVSPSGSDASPGTMEKPLRTLAAAVAAAKARGKDVYAAAGTYAEELRLANGVGVYGGYTTLWKRSLSPATRITGTTTPSGDTEAALAIDITGGTTLQLLTLEPAAPTAPGASSYGLRGIHSPGLRVDHLTVDAAPGQSGAAGAEGIPGAPGGDGADAFVGEGGGSPGGGTSPVGRPGGGGGSGNVGAEGSPGNPGQSTAPDAWNRMGGPGGDGGKKGGGHTAGGPGGDGDSGSFRGDGLGGGAGNAEPGSGFWQGHDGQDGPSGSDGHGGGGGGGGGADDCTLCSGFGGQGGDGGGGGQGGGGGRGGQHGGGSFGIFLIGSAGAVVRDSIVRAGDGGAGGRGGGGALGGAGGRGGKGAPAEDCLVCDNSPGGDGGSGGAGGRGGNGGGGAGGPSIAIVGLGSADAPGTVIHHGSGGSGGGGDVSAAAGAAADYLVAGA